MVNDFVNTFMKVTENWEGEYLRNILKELKYINIHKTQILCNFLCIRLV